MVVEGRSRYQMLSACCATLRKAKTMHNHWATIVKNQILLRLFKLGWEPEIDPVGPVIREATAAGPDPVPWDVAVPQLIQAAIAKDLATKQRNEAAQHTANAAIEALIDDYCGTPPRKVPWPWPGPPPWTWEIVSSLTLFANTLQPGSLRTELESLAGRVAGNVGNSKRAV